MTKNQQELSDNKKHEELAKRILVELDGVMLKKLKELKPELLELRGYFQEKGRSGNILGCETWAAFCSEKLHRSKQAVNQMLAEPKRKETFHPDEPDAATAEGKSPEPLETWEKAQSEAKKKVRHFFTALASVKDIEGKMNDLLDGLIPCRKFKITVEEIEEEVTQ